MSNTAKTPAKKAKAPASHPPVASMVVAAVTALKERNGSSLVAIKKYIATTYKCDVDKLAPFIRRFLKKAVEDGRIKQIKASYKVDKSKVEKPKKLSKKSGTEKKAKKSPKKAVKSKKEKAAKKEKKASAPKKVAKTPKKTSAKKANKTPKKAAKK